MVRERVYRYAPSNYQLNKKIKKIQQDEELKYLDRVIPVNGVANPDGSGILPEPSEILNIISVGTSQYSNRIGGVVKNTSLQWRGILYLDHLNVENEDPVEPFEYGRPMVRMIIYWDSSPNGAGHQLIGSPVTNGAESLLDNTATVGSSNAAASNILLPYSQATVGAGRFKILYDKTFTFNRAQSSVNLANTTTATPVFVPTYPSIFIKGKIKLSRKTFYTGPAATIGAISTNGLYVAFISTLDANIAQDRLLVSGQTFFRLYYKDD